MGVAGGLLVKALDSGSRPTSSRDFSSMLLVAYWLKHWTQIPGPLAAEISLPGALSPTSAMSRRFTFVSFGGDVKLSVLGNSDI